MSPPDPADQRFIPTPLAAILQHFEPILDAYASLRPTNDPRAAFLAAVASAVPKPEANDALSFLHGGMDGRYGQGTGEEAIGDLLLNAEDYWRQMTIMSEAPPGRTTPQPEGDVVALAEWFAGNLEFSVPFVRARSEHPDLAQRLVAGTVADIVACAKRQAFTKMGQKVKIAQADKVFALLGKKAAVHQADPHAAAQEAWCNAVVAALRPLGK